MTNFLCDACTRVFPSGANGTTFLVKPNGYTAHLCSNACLRAYVNQGRMKKEAIYSGLRLLLTAILVTGLGTILIERLINH